MVAIGELRHVIEIQTYTEEQQGDYGQTRTWTTVKKVRAKIEPVSGMVKFDTMQINQTVTHKITIRFYPNVTSENWILFDNRRLRIRYVKNFLERTMWLELLCEEEFPATQGFQVDVNDVGDPLVETILDD